MAAFCTDEEAGSGRLDALGNSLCYILILSSPRRYDLLISISLLTLPTCCSQASLQVLM